MLALALELATLNFFSIDGRRYGDILSSNVHSLIRLGRSNNNHEIITKYDKAADAEVYQSSFGVIIAEVDNNIICIYCRCA